MWNGIRKLAWLKKLKLYLFIYTDIHIMVLTENGEREETDMNERYELNKELAQMLKGGVIMDVTRSGSPGRGLY